MADASISAPVADPTETAVESQADNSEGSLEVLGALPGHGKRIAPLETPPPDNPFQKMELSPAEFPQKIVSPSVPGNPQPGKILDDPFKSMDLSTDEFPTANPTVKDAFNDTLEIHPDKAAEVLKLSNKLGQPPAFVGSNLEASKQAASMPPENYFADLEKKYPVTAKYLSDKQNMAVAKDDIENLTQTEHAVSQYGFFHTMTKAILIGLNRTMAEATQMVPGVSQAALLPFNLTSKLTGHPEQQVRVPEWLQFEAEHNYWEQKAEEHSTHDYARTVSEALTEGGLPGLGKTLAAKVVAGSPQVAGLIVATLMGAETPALIGMAGMTIGDIERQGRLAGTDPTKTSVNALTQAGIQTALMHVGTLGKLGKWSEAITNVVGKDTAAIIMKDIGKNIASAFIGMGAQQAISGYTGEVGDVLSGLKSSESLTGAGSRAAENFLVGGVSGVALAGIPASFGGYARAFRMKQAEMASNVYKAMGTGAEASKYRERLKHGYKEYIQAVTKGTATDYAYFPVDPFDAYFQSKNIDPNEIAKGLGIGDQLQQARETGGNLKVHTDQLIDKLVGTEHFASLADDVKFNESELTINQAKAEAKAATDAVFKEADAAAKDNPVVAEGRDFIYKDFSTKLAASGAYDNQKEREKMIDAHAKLAAAVITGESVRAGVENPKDYYLKGKPLDVVSGQAPSQSAAAQTQSDVFNQENINAVTDAPEFKKFFEGSKVVRTSGEPLVVYHATDKNFESFDRKADSIFNYGKGQDSGGIHFSSDPNTAEYYTLGSSGKPIKGARLIPAFLSIKNPIDIDTGLTLTDQVKALRKAEKSGHDGARIGSDWVVFRPEQVKSIFNEGRFDINNSNIRFQGDPEVDPRGFIQFTPQKTIIGLLKADASTFPHELAHYWLNNFHDFVKSGTAKENHLADWKILSDWMKVEDGQEKLRPDQHEQFARGFESYLREGKAPSEGLRGVFSRFQRWLTKLYRDPIALNVALNPDVRAVMDRMLASEDEIAHARQQMGMELVSDPSTLEPSVRARLEKLRQDARDKAVAELTSEQMKELTAERQAKLTAEAAKARKQAEADLKVTQIQTSIEAIRHTFGKDPREIAGNWRIGKLNEKQSEQLERLAEARGFSGADELTLKVMNEQSLAKQVDDAVAKHMEQFADLKDTNKIKEEALRIVHNDKQTEVLAHERAIFQSLVDEAQGRAADAKQRRAEAQVAIRATKERATEIISKAPVREAGSFMRYFTAERQAAVSAQKAAESGNYAEASAAKQRQMINHALASESMKARREIEKTVRFIDRFASRGQDLKDIPYGIMRHIDKLLGDRGFLAEPRKEDTLTLLKIAQDMAAKSKNLDDSKDEIANLTGFVTDGTGNWHQESLSETAQRFTDNYLPVIIPDSVLHGSGSYKKATLSELRDLKDTIKSLNTVGRSHDNFITEGITASMKAVAAEFRASVEKNIGRPLERALLPGNQFDSKIAEKVNALMKAPGDLMVAELVRFHTFMKYLDGGAEDGPAQNYFYRILKHGENERFRRSDKMKVEVNKIFEDHYAPGELAKYENDRKYFDFTPNNFNKKQILSMALNWGTESNRQRLTDGFGFSEDQIKEMMFKHLTKKDFDFAQSIWKHLDTYKPDITALEMKTMGVEPKYIDSSSFETPWGTYEGGYYPLGYDYQKSMEAKTYNDQKNALYKQFPATSVHTESGYTKARVAFLSRPIRLDPDVLVNHLENVVHDLSFRQGVIDVNRLLRQRDTREAILNAVGQNGYSKIQDDLKSVASDQGESFSKLAGAVQWFRYRGTMSILGVRVKMIPIVAAADVINSVRELGPIRFAGSMSRFVFDPKATTEFVRANSESMAHRSEVRDRDLYDLSQRWFKGKPGLARYVFAIHGWVDQAFTIPMWKTVYDTALDKYGHQKAADLADESINRRFGSNSIIDQAGFQRGSEFKKVWTTGYSWMNMMFNQTWLDGKIAGLQYDKGNYFKASMGIARAGFYLALPGVAETLIREWFHNNQDDNEEASKKRLISGIASFPFKTLPVVSSIAEMGIAKSVGLPAMSMEPAVARSFEEAMKPVGELGSKGLSLLGITDERDISDHFTEDVARTISSMTGVPQSADDIAFAFLDSLNGGGELTWRDLVSRRTKH